VESAKKQGNNKNLGSSIWVPNVLLARAIIEIAPTGNHAMLTTSNRSEAEFRLEADRWRLTNSVNPCKPLNVQHRSDSFFSYWFG
jgi:hypothetical protein